MFRYFGLITHQNCKTYIADKFLDLLHVKIQRSVMAKCVTFSLILIILHLVDVLEKKTWLMLRKEQILTGIAETDIPVCQEGKDKGLTSLISFLRLWTWCSGVSSTDVYCDLRRSYCDLYFHYKGGNSQKLETGHNRTNKQYVKNYFINSKICLAQWNDGLVMQIRWSKKCYVFLQKCFTMPKTIADTLQTETSHGLRSKTVLACIKHSRKSMQLFSRAHQILISVHNEHALKCKQWCNEFVTSFPSKV